MIAVLLSCTSDRAPPTLASCDEADCVANLASATWSGPPYEAKLGDALAVWDDLVFAGAPLYPRDPNHIGVSYVGVASLDRLEPVGRWLGIPERDELTGTSIAVDDLDGDGVPEVAIGQPSGHPVFDVDGAVYLVSGAPAGNVPLAEAAALAFHGPDRTFVGNGVRFGHLFDGSTQLVTCGIGTGVADIPGVVYAIDPTRTGILDEDDALRTLRGPPGFGVDLAVGDLDADGQDDLIVANGLEGVDWFLGPWDAAADEVDRDGAWSVGRATGPIGDHIELVGDVTGDGAPDLGFTALTHLEPVERAGRAYVVAAGDPTSGSVEDLALQVQGRFVGEGVGSAIAGGDVDGDGQDDLVVGASGVYPGTFRGAVLLFLGPRDAAALTADDADARIQGEHVHDFFGRSLALVDADGDARQDLLIGATGWPSDQYRGAVYLVRGIDWLP
ncbi:MAG: integrin alpha [Myxococcota bacterium]